MSRDKPWMVNFEATLAEAREAQHAPTHVLVVKGCDDCPWEYDPEPEALGLRCVHPDAPDEDPAPLHDLCRLPGMNIGEGKHCNRSPATSPDRCPLRGGPLTVQLEEGVINEQG